MTTPRRPSVLGMTTMTATDCSEPVEPTEHSKPTKPTTSRAAPRERGVFLAGTSAVMLHIADDNFLQPEPGMSAGDHLVSGLLPLCLLLLAALTFGRARAGWRAVLALIIGLTGVLVGFVEAGYYSVTVGPSGDDYTGLLAGVAGVSLLALGGVVLWRTRKQTGSRRRRYLRRGAIGLVGVALAVEVVGPFAMGYLSTHVHTAGVPDDPDLGAPYQGVVFTTSDELDIHAWYVPSRNGAAVILPGRTKNHPHARMLVEHGYGVLLYDRRGEGDSEGDPNLYGWGGSRDVHAAVEFLESRDDVDAGRIGGLGLSVSGEMLLEAAAEGSSLAAVVSEGAGTRTMSEQQEMYSGAGEARAFHAMLALHASMRLFSNEDTPESLVDLAPQIAPRPVLLIWAPNSPNQEALNPTYQHQIGPTASLWTIPDSPHVGGLRTHPEEYERRVIDFFDNALLVGAP